MYLICSNSDFAICSSDFGFASGLSWIRLTWLPFVYLFLYGAIDSGSGLLLQWLTTQFGGPAMSVEPLDGALFIRDLCKRNILKRHRETFYS